MRIRLTKKFNIIYYDEPLSEYRLYKNFSGLSGANIVHHLNALEYILLKNRPLLNDLSFEEYKYVLNQVL